MKATKLLSKKVLIGTTSYLITLEKIEGNNLFKFQVVTKKFNGNSVSENFKSESKALMSYKQVINC